MPRASLPLPERRIDFRHPLCEPERKRDLARYLEFLRERDGTPDFEQRTLSRRELFFRNLEADPVLWKGDLDRAAFRRNLDRTCEAGVDPRVLWLLAAAKSNISERYAVELILRSGELREGYGEHSERMFLEEVYHTRILLEACRSCGLEFEMADPPAVMRVFIRLLESASDRVNLPLSYCGELIGVVLFDLLRERSALFADQPEVQQRLCTLTEQILVDELGHLVFCTLKLSRAGLAVSRALLPAVALATLSHVPEFAQLAGGRRALLGRILAFDPAEPPPGLRALVAGEFSQV